jgi:hypothetical protein
LRYSLRHDGLRRVQLVKSAQILSVAKIRRY